MTTGTTSDASAPIRVCFTALHAYPLFDSRVQACVGGAETHAWLLARGLAERRGFDVQFVVEAPRLFRRRRFGSVTVWNRGDGLDNLRGDVSRDVEVVRGFPWLKARRARLRLVWQVPLLAFVRLLRGPSREPTEAHPVYAPIGAHVQACFGVSAHSAAAIASARAAGRPSLLFLESNSDLDERYREGGHAYVNPNGERGDVCRFALENATRIVAQHARQQDLLRQRFGRDSIILPNPIDLDGWDRAAAQHSALLEQIGLRRYVLWVGRADDFHKRPRLCLELARRLQDVSFLMVLNPRDAQIEQEVRRQRPINVTIVDSVPFSEMPAVLSHAAVFVSTGSAEYEGSPNIFLQAAASRVPVASLEVSTSLLEQGGAGFAAGGDLDRLAASVREFWIDSQRSRKLGDCGRRFVERTHALAPVVSEFAQVLDRLARDTCAADGAALPGA